MLVVVDPPTSQFFKYEGFSVSCSGDGQEQEVAGWTVMKRTKDGEVGPAPHPPPPALTRVLTHLPSLQVGPCGPACVVAAAFPATDSGEYWCEGGAGATSNPVSVSVTGTSRQVGGGAMRLLPRAGLCVDGSTRLRPHAVSADVRNQRRP